MRNAGNAAVLRQALERCRIIELQWQADETARQQGMLDKPQDELARDAMTEIECVINAALESPPRNCDVGSVSQQILRYEYRFGKRYELRPCDVLGYAVWSGEPYDDKNPLAQLERAYERKHLLEIVQSPKTANIRENRQTTSKPRKPAEGAF